MDGDIGIAGILTWLPFLLIVIFQGHGGAWRDEGKF